MKTLKPLIWISFATVIVFACKKEFSIENGGFLNPSKGSLQGAPGNCLGIIIGGIYKKDTALTSSNYIDVIVNVTTTGYYSITTDTSNGIYFKGTGNFSTLGIDTARLFGQGTPLALGTFGYNVTYDSTTCSFSLTTIPGGGGTSVFTLDGSPSPNNCTNAAIAGSYTVGTALTSSNTVTIHVTVTTVGTYSIIASTNGMTFSASGTFPGTGAQTIVLTGSGTPTVSGVNTFPLIAGSSSCNFSINVAPAPNPDHFPLTANIWWSYDDLNQLFVTHPGDTIKRVNINSTTFAGNIYRIFQQLENITPLDSAYFRKSINDYFEWNYGDAYTGLIAFDNPVLGDINFLKEGLTTGQTWQSSEFIGTAGGVPLKIQYYDTCTNANASATINGNNFNNVYKISWRPKISLSGGPYTNEVVAFESWFAKGVGLIYFKAIDLTNGNSKAINIRNWYVY